MKIAFCFLIYDEINHEELWYRFFKSVDPNKYSIYIHYKTQKLLKYFEKYKLPNCIPTKYADVSLVHAHNLLFRTAFESDPRNYKFINLSGACIPLKSFDHIYKFLTKDHFGYFNMHLLSSYYPRYNKLLNKFPIQSILKSCEWFILNRDLVKILAYVDTYIINNLYNAIYAPEESYFITFIKKYNMENQIKTTYHESDNSTTFTCWQHTMNYKYANKNIRGLKNYETITTDEIAHLLQSPALFGRKFNKNCTITNLPNINFDTYIYNRLSEYVHNYIGIIGIANKSFQCNILPLHLSAFEMEKGVKNNNTIINSISSFEPKITHHAPKIIHNNNHVRPLHIENVKKKQKPKYSKMRMYNL